jgi:hypothetical protein
MILQRAIMEGNTQSKMDGRSKTECDWPWRGTRRHWRQGNMEKLSFVRRKTVVQWTDPWMNEMAKWIIYELNASYNFSTWWSTFKYSKTHTKKSVFFHLTPCNLVINNVLMEWSPSSDLYPEDVCSLFLRNVLTYLPK